MTTDWDIIRYTPRLRQQWDELVLSSRNATFLHRRDYMDYHADRFDDYSLLALHKGKPKALLPANIDVQGRVHSHQGLTYGGWLLPQKGIDGTEMITLWHNALSYLESNGITEMIYAPVPYIYHTTPAQEDIYALWRIGATIDRVLLASVAEAAIGPQFDSMRRRHLRNAVNHGVTISEIQNPATGFWQMLTDCLASRHDAIPVHTLSEIQKLHSLFPDNIRFFGAFTDSTLQAGICIYHSGKVAHCQYIATTPEGRTLHALAPLTAHLFTPGLFPGCRYIDFGTSNEADGHILNAGLNANKSGYGATGVAYIRYKLHTDAWRMI